MNQPELPTSQTSCVLAFDTSRPGGECALLRSTGEAGEVLLSDEIRISRTLLPQVQELLRTQGVEADMIRAIGVAIGPGTFTGLRVGLSCAKGIALGLRRPLYGFSSLEVMATAALLEETQAGRNPPAYVLPYRDARYGELFTALFRVSQDAASPRESTLVRATRDQTIARDALSPPDGGCTLLAGKKEELPETLTASRSAPAHREIDSSAAATAWLTHAALMRGTPSAGADLALNYCRKPQAQTKWGDPRG